MSYQIIGTCSLCSGPVVMPTAWMSIITPLPACQNCHAVIESKEAYGPSIKMTKNFQPQLLNEGEVL